MAAASGARGRVWPSRGKGLGVSSLQRGGGGPLGAQRPGCTGAPPPWSSPVVEPRQVQQSISAVRVAPRCPPPPSRAPLPSFWRRRLPAPPPPPPPLRPLRAPHAGCALRVLPPAAPSSPRFSSRSLTRRRLAATSLLRFAKCPWPPRASRCREVSGGQRISGRRIWSLRIAAAAAARRPREAAARSPKLEGGGPRLGHRSVPAPSAPPRTPRTRNPFLV